MSGLSDLLDGLEQARAKARDESGNVVSVTDYAVAAIEAAPTLVAALRRVEALAGELDGGMPCDSGEHGRACNWNAADRIRAVLEDPS